QAQRVVQPVPGAAPAGEDPLGGGPGAHLPQVDQGGAGGGGQRAGERVRRRPAVGVVQQHVAVVGYRPAQCHECRPRPPHPHQRCRRDEFTARAHQQQPQVAGAAVGVPPGGQPGVALERRGRRAPPVQPGPVLGQGVERALDGDPFDGVRHSCPCTSAAGAGPGTDAARAGSGTARRGRASSASPPSRPPALAPTAPVTVHGADDGSVGSVARANCRSSTRVACSAPAAWRVSARETALAMSAATSGRDEVAVTDTIGASGEVAVRTFSRRVRTGTPAHTWASPSTASWPATRPYAWANPSAVPGSEFSFGTATT